VEAEAERALFQGNFKTMLTCGMETLRWFQSTTPIPASGEGFGWSPGYEGGLPRAYLQLKRREGERKTERERGRQGEAEGEG
jgi:hypothetical protein